LSHGDITGSRVKARLRTSPRERKGITSSYYAEFGLIRTRNLETDDTVLDPPRPERVSRLRLYFWRSVIILWSSFLLYVGIALIAYHIAHPELTKVEVILNAARAVTWDWKATGSILFSG